MIKSVLNSYITIIIITISIYDVRKKTYIFIFMENIVLKALSY